jgi:hypothetical protein
MLDEAAAGLVTAFAQILPFAASGNVRGVLAQARITTSSSALEIDASWCASLGLLAHMLEVHRDRRIPSKGTRHEHLIEHTPLNRGRSFSSATSPLACSGEGSERPQRGARVVHPGGLLGLQPAMPNFATFTLHSLHEDVLGLMAR